MNDEQSDQSVKDILEDIKKAISGKNTSDNKVKVDNNKNDDVFYLKKEYLKDQDVEEDSDEENISNKNYDHQEEVIYNENQLDKEEVSDYLHSDHTLHRTESDRLHGNNMLHKTENDNLHSNNTSYRTESDHLENDGHLIFKENMEEIKVLLEKMQNALQQQSKPNLTVEELVMSLLKPELSEWLNKHLYKLVKEVVEKELKDIINNNK